MIGIAIEKWDDAALRRIVDAPIERWFAAGDYDCARGWWDDGSAPVCLYGFVADRDEHWAVACTRDAEDGDGPDHYDRLVRRFGLPRVVRACKIRARAILEERHPLAKLVVLRAEVGA